MATPLGRFDCAVIGAGVVGLSVAHELLSHGLSVCVIDRQQPGKEASWAGAGLLPPGSRYSNHPALEALARASHPLNAALSEAIHNTTGIDDGYWRCGAIYLASDFAEAAALDAMTARWTALDIECRQLAVPEVTGLLPQSENTIREVAAANHAFWVPSEAQLRNPRRLKGMVQLCTHGGAHFLLNDAVAMVKPDESSVRLELQTGRRIEAGRVVVASGAWSNAFLPVVERRQNVKPIRGQMLLLESPEGKRLLECNVHVDHRYAAPRKDGFVLVGSTVEDAGFDKSTTAEGCSELLRFASSLGLGGMKLAKAWAGLRPATDDSLPLVGPLPENDRILFATGHFRAGLQFSPATAQLIREIIMGQPPSIDITPFRIDR